MISFKFIIIFSSTIVNDQQRQEYVVVIQLSEKLTDQISIKDLCSLCADKGLVMPSVDLFQQHHKNLKLYEVFYEYFLKSVVGHTEWMRTLGNHFADATMFAMPSNEVFTLLCFVLREWRSGVALISQK
jgi:hypothetical protein